MQTTEPIDLKIEIDEAKLAAALATAAEKFTAAVQAALRDTVQSAVTAALRQQHTRP